MARTSYDDWNFMGEIHDAEKKFRGPKPTKGQQVNSHRNSFIFLCVVILLTFMGLVCVYSASFDAAVNQGLPHYHYLLRQSLYVLVGIVLAVVVNLVSEKVLKILSPILFFACIVALAVDLIIGKSILMNSDMINLLFLAGVMYLSLYFSSRGNKVEKLKQLIPPVLGCIVVLALILLKRNFSYAAMFLAIGVTMFAAGGVGFFGVLLMVLYIAVPVLVIIFSKSERILAVARFFIPGIGTGVRSNEVMAVKSAISSGSWFGKGLGGGVYKSDVISDLYGKNIMANICEELGFWGIVMIIVFIAFYAFVGYSAAKYIRKHNLFHSNLAIGITTVVVWQFILNILWVLGVLPTEGLPMPFFSYGVGIIPILFESGILYRIAKEKVTGEENEKVLASIQEELMFPERYDIEKT